MFTGFIYIHIQIGILYVNKPFYELLSEKKIQSFSTFFKIITLFHNAFCYEKHLGELLHFNCTPDVLFLLIFCDFSPGAVDWPVVCECGISWLYSKGTHCLDFIAKYRGHKLTQTLPVVHVLW